MHDVVVRLRRVYRTANGKKLFRYTIVSVVSTVVSFTLLGIVFGVLRLWTEVPSAIFANIVSLAPSYYLNRSWAWGKTGRSHWRREVLPFWVLSVGGVLLSIVAAATARHISIANHLSHAEATAILLTVVIVAFGFLWVLKFLVFNRLFKVTPPGVPQRIDPDV